MSKVAIVIQRYGKEIIGGAEAHARIVAEKLQRDLNWSVTVYTTQALDYVTWENHYTTREESIDGIRVKRYPVWFPRMPRLFGLVNHYLTPVLLRLAQGKRLARFIGRRLEYLWFVLQGPYAPGLVRALKKEAHQYDKVFFFTYLYYPTLFGAKALKKRQFSLIPTAHREPPFYFQHVRRLMLQTSHLLVNIEAEQNLIESRMGQPLPSAQVAGLGFDLPQDLPVSRTGRYLIYLGRICHGKGVGFLIEAFQKFVQKRPDCDLQLVLVGKKDEDFAIPNDPRIDYKGFVDESDKFRLIRGCFAVVNPSQYESLSMIAIEAMVCEKPLLLNRSSEVLDHYCRVTRTCFGFANQDEFISQLERVLHQDWQSPAAQAELQNSRHWVENRYSWRSILAAYQASPDFRLRSLSATGHRT